MGEVIRTCRPVGGEQYFGFGCGLGEDAQQSAGGVEGAGWLAEKKEKEHVVGPVGRPKKGRRVGDKPVNRLMKRAPACRSAKNKKKKRKEKIIRVCV